MAEQIDCFTDITLDNYDTNYDYDITKLIDIEKNDSNYDYDITKLIDIEKNAHNYGGITYYSDVAAIKIVLSGYICSGRSHFFNSIVGIICLLGLVGNGSVIWLLGFRMKRNPFTTYILNLSIADVGVLLSLVIIVAFVIVITPNNISNILLYFFLFFLDLFFLMYSTGQFLLAAISIDRCVAVLFPLWHRCHRPPHLSAIVCVLIWVLSFLLSGIHFTRQMTGSAGNFSLLFQHCVNGLLCTPVMVVSTLILFVHVCCKSEQRQWGKLVTAILLALLFFLLFAFPMNAFYVIYSFSFTHYILIITGLVCASLNSSINPLIYFLVGRRRKKGQPRVSMKVALQRVFRDEQDCDPVQTTH